MDKYTQFKKDEELLFAEFKRKMGMEAARAQIKKLEYNLSDVTCGLSAVKSGCADATSLLLGGICVAPDYVKSCSAFLGPPQKRASSLIACISYPNGNDSTEIKVKAVKKAIKDGADEVEVTAPISRVRDGNFLFVKREFKKLRKAAKNRSIRISAECALLSAPDVKRLCALAADCRINSVKISATPADSVGATLPDVRMAVKDKCTIKAEGVSSVTEMSAAVDLGATVVGSKNAPAVARYILAAAQNENLI